MSQNTEFQRMPSIGEISFSNEFSIPTPDDEINNIISYFKNCILSIYGLDDFLA